MNRWMKLCMWENEKKFIYNLYICGGREKNQENEKCKNDVNEEQRIKESIQENKRNNLYMMWFCIPSLTVPLLPLLTSDFFPFLSNEVETGTRWERGN